MTEGKKLKDFVSLDREYNHHKRYPQWHLAIENHIPIKQDEIELKIGDAIKYNEVPVGLGIGTNQRTNETGRYPLNKVKKLVRTAEYAAFV